MHRLEFVVRMPRYAENVEVGNEILVQVNNHLTPEKVTAAVLGNMQGLWL